MVRLNVHEAKTHLSRYLRRLEQEGETIVLCRHNRPIAEIRPLGEGKRRRRVFGLDEGRIVLRPEFFEPLDEETLGYFGGERG
jgi:antitoxin (DNA-binding transcriptional repressor) of toxin-antitoxin stability system